MFTAQSLISAGPLRTLWLAATHERSLNKQQVEECDLQNACISIQQVATSGSPLGLRLSSQLLLGVARIYGRQVKYLEQDATRAQRDMLKALAAGTKAPTVDLPRSKLTAPAAAITALAAAPMLDLLAEEEALLGTNEQLEGLPALDAQPLTTLLRMHASSSLQLRAGGGAGSGGWAAAGAMFELVGGLAGGLGGGLAGAFSAGLEEEALLEPPYFDWAHDLGEEEAAGIATVRPAEGEGGAVSPGDEQLLSPTAGRVEVAAQRGTPAARRRLALTAEQPALSEHHELADDDTPMSGAPAEQAERDEPHTPRQAPLEPPASPPPTPALVHKRRRRTAAALGGIEVETHRAVLDEAAGGPATALKAAEVRQLIADPSPLLLLPQRAFSSGHQRRMHAHQGAAALAAQQAGLVAAGPLLEMADAPELRALFQVAMGVLPVTVLTGGVEEPAAEAEGGDLQGAAAGGVAGAPAGEEALLLPSGRYSPATAPLPADLAELQQFDWQADHQHEELHGQQAAISSGGGGMSAGEGLFVLPGSGGYGEDEQLAPPLQPAGVEREGEEGEEGHDEGRGGRVWLEEGALSTLALPAFSADGTAAAEAAAAGSEAQQQVVVLRKWAQRLLRALHASLPAAGAELQLQQPPRKKQRVAVAAVGLSEAAVREEVGVGFETLVAAAAGGGTGAAVHGGAHAAQAVPRIVAARCFGVLMELADRGCGGVGLVQQRPYGELLVVSLAERGDGSM